MRAKDYQDKIDKLQHELAEARQEIQGLNIMLASQLNELNDLKKQYITLCRARPDKKRLRKLKLETIRQDKVITELNKKLHAGGRAALSQEEQDKILELRLAHHSIREIAQKLHHSTRTIQKYTVAVDDERTKESNKEKERNEIVKNICPFLLDYNVLGGLPPMTKFSCPVQEQFGIYPHFFDIPSHDDQHE